MEELFRNWAAILALLVEAVAALLIAVGVLEAIVVLIASPPDLEKYGVESDRIQVSQPSKAA